LNRLSADASLLLALVNHLLPPKAFAATPLLFDYQFVLAAAKVQSGMSASGNPMRAAFETALQNMHTSL